MFMNSHARSCMTQLFSPPDMRSTDGMRTDASGMRGALWLLRAYGVALHLTAAIGDLSSNQTAPNGSFENNWSNRIAFSSSHIGSREKVISLGSSRSRHSS